MPVREPLDSSPIPVDPSTPIRSGSLELEQPATSVASEWMTTAEAAAYLKVKRRTLLKWVREGSVKARPLHGTLRHVWRFRRQDLDFPLGLKKPTSSSVLELPASSVVRVRKGGSL